MAVTLSYPKVWEYEDGTQVTTSYTKVGFTYTKQDERIMLLKVQLVIGTSVVGESVFDVSTRGVGETVAITAIFENGQQPATVTQTGETTLTIPAGGSVTYAPSGVDAIVLAGQVGGVIYVNNQQYPYSNNVVVQNGQVIEVRNPTASTMEVTVKEIQAAPKFTATVRFLEMDENQNVLYTQEAVIEDVPPLVIQAAAAQQGDIEVIVVG